MGTVGGERSKKRDLRDLLFCFELYFLRSVWQLLLLMATESEQYLKAKLIKDQQSLKVLCQSLHVMYLAK